MATKPTQGSAKRSTGSRSTTAARRSGGAAKKPAKPRATSAGTRASSRNGASRASTKRAASTAKRPSSPTTNGRSNGNGVADTLKDVATKAKGPAVAVGAAAAGLAGGLVLKGRTGRKKVLGVPVPRGGFPDIDMKSVAKSVGHASKRFAKSSRSVSKELERASDQAERIGKILG